MNLTILLLLSGALAGAVWARKCAKDCEPQNVLQPEGSREHRTVRFVGQLNCTLDKMFCASPFYSEGNWKTNDYVGHVSPRCSSNGSLYHDLILILKPGESRIDFQAEVDIIHNCSILTNALHTSYKFERLVVNTRKAFIQYSLDLTSLGGETGFLQNRERNRKETDYETECQILIRADGTPLRRDEIATFLKEKPISFLSLLFNLYFFMFEKLRFVLFASFFLLAFCFYNRCQVWLRIVRYFGF